MTERVHEENYVPNIQKIIVILWPSFLMAGIATILFFAAVDPVDLGPVIGIDDIDRLEFYSIGFFSFWLLTGCSSSLTRFFEKPCDVINRNLRKKSAA